MVPDVYPYIMTIGMSIFYNTRYAPIVFREICPYVMTIGVPIFYDQRCDHIL